MALGFLNGEGGLAGLEEVDYGGVPGGRANDSFGEGGRLAMKPTGRRKAVPGRRWRQGWSLVGRMVMRSLLPLPDPSGDIAGLGFWHCGIGGLCCGA